MDNPETLPTTVTINFESLTQSGTGFGDIGLTYAEQGFVFGDVLGFYGFGRYETGNPNYAGSTMLYNDTAGSETSLSQQNGGQFDFLGMDLAKLQSPDSTSITFSGYRGSDLVVTETFNFIGNGGVQRFVPQMDFSGITELRWPQAPPVQFDNVELQPHGGAGPGPQARIVNGGSVWRIDFSYMIPGATYSVQRSDDLIEWETLSSFTPYAPTSSYEYPADPGASKGFFRLQWGAGSTSEALKAIDNRNQNRDQRFR